MNRLGFSDAESMILSFGEFYDLYWEYQKVFDLETLLRKNGFTYQSLEETGRDGTDKPIAW